MMELRKKKIVSYNDSPEHQQSATLTILNSKKPRSSARQRYSSSVFKVGCDAASVAQSSEHLLKHDATKYSIKEKLFYESDDELEAFGFETNHQLQIRNPSHKTPLMGENVNPNNEERTVCQNTLSESTHISLIEQSSIAIEDIVPVNIITSVLSELFKERFPKPKDLNVKFICRWCKPDRVNINRYWYKSVQLLVQHYLIKHKEIPMKDYGIQCNNCQAYFFHKQRLEMHIVKAECHEYNIQNNDFQRSGGSKITMDHCFRVCSFCCMVFLSKKRFQKHLLKDVDGCRFESIDHPMELGSFDYMKCKFCDEMYLFEDDFQSHVKPWGNKEYLKNNSTFKCRNVSRPVFTCKVCLQKYCNATTFGQHICIDHNIEEFEILCDRCGKHFLLASELIEHKENMKIYPTCIDFEACRTIPKRIDKDLEARRIVSKLGCYKCPVCSHIISKGRTQLSQHIRSFHPSYKTTWECCDCNKTFIILEDYENHMTKWKCPFCVETIFSMKTQLTAHCWRKHTRVKQNKDEFICDICNSNLTRKAHLIKHKRTAHNDLKECPFCSVTDNTIKNMYRHIKLYHVYKSPAATEMYDCNLCENKVSFRDKMALNRHIATVHNKTQKAECDICNKTFAQKATMVRHRRIHLGIKPFKCDICELSFTQKTGMKAHRGRHYNKDGTMKSQEDLQMQVEIIKQQRVTLKVALNADKVQKKRFREKKIPCETCGFLFTSKAKFESHPCRQGNPEEPSEEEVYKGSDTDDDNGIGAPEYDFRCDECHQTFVSVERLGAHRCRKKVKNDIPSHNGIDSDCDDYQKYTNKETPIKERTSKTKSAAMKKKENAERCRKKQRKTTQQTITHKQSLSKTRTKTSGTEKKLQRSTGKHKQANNRHSKKSESVAFSARNMQKHREISERYPLRGRQQNVAANIKSLKPQCRTNYNESSSRENCQTGEPTVESGNEDSQCLFDDDDEYFVNAPSFTDVEGGFNCIKCRAMFCDTEVFKYHECKIFKS